MYNEIQNDKILVKCCPAPRQIAIQTMEFYAFAHFSINTFTDREWGDGGEDPKLFCPEQLNTDQWVETLRAAEIKGLILTCKHHDGFCLWPSAYTEHSVKNSPFREGKGDVVREVAEACMRGGLKFGVYLSPWDRNSPVYGQGKAYDDYFCCQLTELLTQYGEIFTVWFDGACGEGPNGRIQQYDWDRYYALIRELQPQACISICGPDVRWCGNETGDTRQSEWSVLPTGFLGPDEVAEQSQKQDDASFRLKTIDPTNRDLGSRSFLQGAQGYRWYPCETDVSIRPGWFYHETEDGYVRSADQLLDLWYRTVGGNSTLLLNIPPDRRGLLHENDVMQLTELGNRLRQIFSHNLAENATFASDHDDGYHTAEALRFDNYESYYKPFDGENAVSITVKLKTAADVTHIVLKEHIPLSQRVERYVISVRCVDGTWLIAATGTTIGYKKVERFPKVLTDTIRIDIEDSRVCPIMSFVGIYSA